MADITLASVAKLCLKTVSQQNGVWTLTLKNKYLMRDVSLGDNPRGDELGFNKN